MVCLICSFSWVPTLTDSESEEESDSSFEVPPTKRKKPKKTGPIRGGRKKQQRGRANSASSDDYGKKGKGRGKKTYNGPKRGVTTSAIRFEHSLYIYIYIYYQKVMNIFTN